MGQGTVRRSADRPGSAPPAIHAFYAAALLGLRRLDAMGVPPERFSPAADGHWKTLCGALGTEHRIDLLIRDASRIQDAAHRLSAAFAPAAIFDIAGVTEDDPFGPEWTRLDAQEAHDSWGRARDATADDPTAVCQRWAELLGVTRPSAPPPTLGPTDVVVALGPTAAWHLLPAFAGRPDRDWPQQVVVVAGNPAERQFAGLLGLLASGTRAPRATRLEALDLSLPGAPGHPFREAVPRCDRLVVSSSSPEAAVSLLTALFPEAEVDRC